MQIDETKLKRCGVALGLVVFLLAGLDFLVLKGEVVGGGSTSLRDDSQPLVIDISRVGEEHVFEVSTRKRRHGETVGQSIAYQLTAPDGTVVYEDSELVGHKKRFFDFTPSASGAYVFEAQETKLVGSGRGSANVRVLVGDRRVLSRLIGF